MNTVETLLNLAKQSREANPKAQDENLARLFVAYLIGYTRAMDGEADELARLVGMPHLVRSTDKEKETES